MPYKGGLQLLPETQRRPTLGSYTSGNGYFWSGISIGIAIVVIGAILGGYSANLTDQLNKLDGDLSSSESARDKNVEQVLLNAQQQANIMRGLLGSKIYWSQALGQMEKMAQSSVTFTNITGDVTLGTIKFHASGPDYATVAKQIAAFTAGTGVSDVSVGSAVPDPDKNGAISFDGILTFDSKLFLNKAPAATVTP